MTTSASRSSLVSCSDCELAFDRHGSIVCEENGISFWVCRRQTGFYTASIDVYYTLGRTNILQVHREVRFWSSELAESAVIAAVEAFSTGNPDWAFKRENTAKFTKLISSACCVVLRTVGNSAAAALHVATSKSGRFYIVNIVPLQASKLTIDEYNQIATRFSTDFSSYCKDQGLPIRIKATSSEVDFDDVLSAPIPRKLFRRFLGAHPRSYHPRDIERLDQFTCAVATYARKPLDLDSLEYLLMEKLGWSSEDAKWCRTRIEIGLEVLAVYRK